MYKKVNPKQSFPELEKEIINFWDKNKIFEKSIETRKDSEEFNFYDGPPFATGTPHYWHLLAWTIKDVIPRYQTMLWKRVDRVFGWDCHWLPIENIVEKKLEISGRDDIMKVWVKTFNEECRANVAWYTDVWKQTVKRIGRWVDMENAYKTMDRDFMESVWWVYKSLYNKWLIYEWNRIVPYCPRCTTPLSNFEVNQGYKDKQDKTITVKFKVLNNENKYILAWTTTPWTLMSNLWLAVGADITYVEIKDNDSGETYVLAKDRLKDYYKKEEDYSIIREYPGTCLEWIKYEPIFDDFKIELEEMWEDLGSNIKLWKNTYSVVIGHHVTTESWTWIVHIAPAYWEDDYIIWEKNDLGFVAHIDDSWKVTNTLSDNWKYVFDYNEEVIKQLKDRWDVVKISTIDHSYPHCWRCDTPLIYRWISAWYVAVEKIRDKMIANNQKVNWVPEVIKNGRFGKWLEWARDWNISRNRYWGSAIPVWQSEDKKSEVCIWSIEELYELNKDFGQIEKKNWEYYYTDTNKKVDIHKHFVDEIKLKHPETWETLYRIPEVLDCWFESWAMPYASKHYPFDEKINPNIKKATTNEEFEKIDKFFWDMWKKEFNLDRSWKVEEYKKGRCFYLEENGEIISCLYSFSSKKFWKEYIWRLATKKEFRWKGLASDLLKMLFTELYNNWKKEIALNAEVNNVKFYEYFGFKIKWEVEKLKENEEIESIYMEKEIDKSDIYNFKFPADFIAEWLDQTRGWFYTLLILGTALFDNTPYLNVIVNWIILAEDGKKMSKSLKNYPDPNEILEKYWADALRFYLMNSPVVEAQEFRFSESWVEEVVKKVLLPLWNTYYFFTTYANIDNFTPSPTKERAGVRSNPLDKWLISELNKLTAIVKEGFDNYKLNNATRPIVKFMDALTNWYIRRSRKRFWKTENDNDKIQAYETLYYTLVELSKIIAPFMPFISEYIFKNLTQKESVHLEYYPEVNKKLVFEELNENMARTRDFITLGLAARAKAKLRVRQPLAYAKIWSDLSDYYKEILKEELNVKEIKVFDESEMPKKICKPNGRAIWPKFGKDVKFIMTEAKAWNFEELDWGKVKVWEFILEPWEFEIVLEESENKNKNEVLESWFGTAVAISTELTPELIQEWIARDLVRQIQEARKDADYQVDDRIQVSISWENIKGILENFWEYIENETLSKINNNLEKADLEKEVEIEWEKINLTLKK